MSDENCADRSANAAGRDSPWRDCPWRDCAALEVLGALDAAQSSLYRAHLEACEACSRELAVVESDVAAADERLALEDLARDGAPAPDPRLRQRLLASLEDRGTPRATPAVERPWTTWNAARPVGASTAGFGPGMYAVAHADGEWRPAGVPGIEVKRLAADLERRVVTMLIRMAPGSRYPAHRHASAEECYVVSGDLQVGEREMAAGDYQLCDAGSTHPVQSTRGGCVLFLTSSQDDELIEV